MTINVKKHPNNTRSLSYDIVTGTDTTCCTDQLNNEQQNNYHNTKNLFYNIAMGSL